MDMITNDCFFIVFCAKTMTPTVLWYCTADDEGSCAALADWGQAPGAVNRTTFPVTREPRCKHLSWIASHWRRYGHAPILWCPMLALQCKTWVFWRCIRTPRGNPPGARTGVSYHFLHPMHRHDTETDVYGINKTRTKQNNAVPHWLQTALCPIAIVTRPDSSPVMRLHKWNIWWFYMQ